MRPLELLGRYSERSAAAGIAPRGRPVFRRGRSPGSLRRTLGTQNHFTMVTRCVLDPKFVFKRMK